MATNIIDVGNNTFGGSTGGFTIVPVALTTALSPQNGTAVDCIDAELPINVELGVGVYTAPGTLDVKMQAAKEDPATPGSALSSDWEDISGATFTQVTASGVAPVGGQWLLVKNMGGAGNATKRFMRAVATSTGGGGSVLGYVRIIAQKKITGTAGGYSTSPTA